MAAFKFAVDIDLAKNQLLNAVLQNLSTHPSTSGLPAGFVYYNTASNTTYQWTGSAWLDLGAGSNLALGTLTSTTVPITNDNGTGVTLPAATTTLAGVMSAADKVKLNGIGTGASVSSFSAGNLSPLFTTSVANATTTPSLTFALTSANANTWFGNNTGSSAAPSYNSLAALTKTDDTNVTLTLGGTPTTALAKAVSITVGWTGTLAISRGGTGLGTLGTANQLLRVNSGATALEYFTPPWTTNTGTVTSVGMTIGGAAITVSGSPITTSGTLALTWTGTTGQYVRGDGSLATFPSIPQGTVTSVSAGNGMSFTTITTSGAVTLGTPSSITLASTNSVSTNSHTHEFAPGGTSAQYIAGDGTLITFPTIYTTLASLTDVTITSVANNQLLKYNSTTSMWENWTPNFLTGNQTITLTGDVTGSGTTSIATTIATSAVSFAKMQNIPTQTLMGRYTTGTGVVQSITLGTGLTLNSTTGVLTATGTGGTVTSVGLSLPAIFSVSGSPVTSSGTLTATLATQTQKTFFAAPNASNGTPSFRTILPSDLGTGTTNTTTYLRGDGTWFALINDASTTTSNTWSADKINTELASITSAMAGGLINKGGYDAATDTPSLDDGTPIAGIKNGWVYVVTDAGQFFAEDVQVGDMLVANQDNPTTLAHWTVVNKNIPDIVAATTTQQGIVELADNTETQTGTDGTRAVTPSGLSSRTATDTRTGLIELATQAEVNAGSDTTRAVTPATLVTYLNNMVGGYTATFGNGTLTSFNFTHGLNTTYVTVEVIEESTGQTIGTQVQRTSTSVVNVQVNVPPTTNQYRVIIKK